MAGTQDDMEMSTSNTGKTSVHKKTKKSSKTGNVIPRSETTPRNASGAERPTTEKPTVDEPAVNKPPEAAKPAEESELSKFGSMLTNSMLSLQETMSKQFEQLQSTIEKTWSIDEHELLGSSDEEDGSVMSENGAKNDYVRKRRDEPRPKRRRDISPSELSDSTDDGKRNTNSSSSKTDDNECEVLTAIAQRLTKTEPTDTTVNEQLAKLVNELMFKSKRPDESKLKENGEKILRPQNCESLVVTKVDELIWNRLRPNTRSFDSRVQTVQSMLIKGVIEITKMLNSMLEMKTKTNVDKTSSSDEGNVEASTKIDKLIDKGMSAIEMLSHANYELNMRRRECIKPDLNEDYQTSLFSSSVPVNSFLFGGDTSKRLEDIDKTNRAVKKAMGKSNGQSSRKNKTFNKQYGRSRGYGGSNNYKYSRNSHSSSYSSSRRPFLGKRSYNQQEKKGKDRQKQ